MPASDQDVTLKEYLESKIVSVEETMRAAYPSRTELLALLKDIDTRLTKLEISKARLEGKASVGQAYIAIGISIIGIVIAVIGLLK